MKKSLLIATFCFPLLFSSCNSCSNDKKVEAGSVQDIKETYAPVPQISTSRNDTVEVMQSVNSFVSALKDRNLDTAINMLSYLDNDTIKSLPKALLDRERVVLGTVLGASKYEIEHLVFHKEKDNEVRIKVTLFEKSEGDPAPNTMGMILKPVRRDGKWYLTMADSESDTNHGTEIMH